MKNAPFTIIWENEAYLAVSKISGIPVCPERYAPLDAECGVQHSAPLNYILEEQYGCKLFICHRIDRETSGLVVFAKNAESHRLLSRAFEKKLVKKRYTAILRGVPSWKETVCSLPLLPDGNKRHLTIVEKHRGKPSTTIFRVLFSAGRWTAAEIMPQTGRTHQIRAHAAALGCPIACDSLYGELRAAFPETILLSSFKPGWRGDKFEERPLLSRLALHAASLTLPPDCAQSCGVPEPLKLEAPLPKDMSATMRQLEKVGVT